MMMLISFADLTDGVELCGAFCVWLTKDAMVARRDEIVEKGLLRARIAMW